MFTVISRWEFDPARETEVKAMATETMQKLLSWDGIEEGYNVRVGPGAVLAILTYRDEPTYQSMIKDPNGPLAQLIGDNNLKYMATSLCSEHSERE